MDAGAPSASRELPSPPAAARELPGPPSAARELRSAYDVLAPDGSEIRLLGESGGASMVHARLPAGATARAVVHRTVDELWFCLRGTGEIWRGGAGGETTTALRAGTSLTIACGTAFQWRNLGTEPLDVLIATSPPWPGEQEAVPARGPWEG